MKFGYAILLLTGIVALLVLICLAVIRYQRDFPNKKYDERQQASRGKAYQFSWVMGWGYNLIVMVVLIMQAEGRKVVEPYLLIMAGIMLQVMAFECYCVLTDSAVAPSEKPGTYIGGGIALGLMYLANAALLGGSWYLPLVGRECFGWVWLLCAAAFLFRGITQLLRQRRQNRE